MADAAALAALEARLLLKLEESKKETDAKIAALTHDAGRAPFLSPTSARSLLETIRSSKKLRIVNGTGLPWKKSRFNVTLVTTGRTTTTLFSTLPKTPKILKEMAHLQPWLTRQTPLIDGASFRVSWVDGHKFPSIGSRKPDILHYPKGDSPSVFQLAIVGDLKSQTSSLGGEPSDEAIACLIDFLSALAAVQIWRRQFIGYLIDGIHISFVVVDFDSSPKRGESRAVTSMLQSFPMLCSGEGGHFLRGLLEANLSITGPQFPDMRVSLAGSESSLKLEAVLGLGATSTVFQTTLNGQRCAVKLPHTHDGSQVHAPVERSALKRLKARDVLGVPRIVCDAVDRGVLVTAPVGRPIAMSEFEVHVALEAHRQAGAVLFAGSHPKLVDANYCHLVISTLRDMHNAGVIQGDMRLSNLVADVVDPVVDEADPVAASSVAASSVSSPEAASDTASAPVAATRAEAGPCAVLARRLTIIDFGSAFIAKIDPDANAPRPFKRVKPALWISLPYAHPDVLKAFATMSKYRPEPSHDLFMFAASLHRLLVPWAPYRKVDCAADATALVRYWDLLMAPVTRVCPDARVSGSDVADGSAEASAGVKRRRESVADASETSSSAAAGSAPNDTAATYSPWGLLFRAASKYDLPAFESAAGFAVRSVVPDWPW